MHFPTTTPSPSALLPVRGCEGAIIDAAWLPAVSGYLWTLARGYVVRHYWDGARQRKVYLARVVTGAASGQEAHHLNGLLDNRREALALLTVSEHRTITRLETGPRKGRTKGAMKGVYPYYSRTGEVIGWKGQIRLADALHHLGIFATAEEAGRAVDRHRLDWFLSVPGRLPAAARLDRIALNFPEELERFLAETRAAA